ncbi:PREDICTED: uncharacterized protein LOC104749719 [Camelina sativa]|uniref:Uncharacterized protein LOC104749719 n=1 Tax=Camelina sativa TaxID=90675 RepID=A0ABM0WDY6_CAMSA|nr:PREDICTED: uncharacterized protein LOC104749719 [Camelina sativa]
MIRECGMLEFPCYGESLSWRGNRCNNQVVRCRLDRALGNEDWHTLFPCSRVDYLEMIGSDHRPILASCAKADGRHFRQFRFDKRWMGKEGFSGAVESGWNRTKNFRVPMFVDKIKNCRNSISWRRKQNVPNSNTLISSLKMALEEAKNDDSISHAEIHIIEKKLKDAYHDEELYWQQKSRKFWLRVGDKNTSFFHASTKQRRTRNKIVGLFDSEDVWDESNEGMERIASDYFNKLFAQPDVCGISEMVQAVNPFVTERMNRELTKDISEMEVRKALFAMHPEITPGPDGMTALFFHRFWPHLKGDLIALVRDFFRTGKFDPRLNETNICLIPKVDVPKRMAEFKPISLCNVGYKIISKILCFQLKKILPLIISETQSAFVSGRLITDNILVAQEMFHGLQTNRMCNTEFLAFKTDMSKAYDRVEWDFLKAALIRLGFDSRWISWIMWCVSSVSYQVLLNGQPRGSILPKRGLWQGDPLSPYLFILCTEVLIANIKKAEREGKISGIKIARDSPPISHLLFVDDSLFFSKADEEQCSTVMDVIGNYSKASDQEVNLDKSSIMFGKKVPAEVKDKVKSVIGISNEGGMGSYLGIPESLGGSRVQVFGYVRDWLNDRVNGWTAKFLSKGGKEVLLKSVALTLPTHVMSCFKLPQGLTSKLTSAISNFWWSSDGKDRGLHWVAWDKMCKDKSEGRLGFWDLEIFNDALLAKQYWRLIQFLNSLFAQRSIFSTKSLVEKGIRWTIGSGFNISVWHDPWIPDQHPRPARGRGQHLHPNLMVNHLINPRTKEWHLPILQEYMDPEDIQIILSLPISKYFRPDRLVWHYTQSGRYSVKSGYKVAQDMKADIEVGPNVSALKAKAWELPVPPKIKHFFWQIASGSLPVTVRLASRGVNCDTICKRCDLEEESINHTLFECPHSRQVWERIFDGPDMDKFPAGSIYSNLDFIYGKGLAHMALGTTHSSIPWLVWFLWKDRNSKKFQGLRSEPMDIINQALREQLWWKESQLTARVDSASTDSPITLEPLIHCQVDGSWKATEPHSGLGWWCGDGENQTLVMGAKCHRRSASPLYSELEALLWAMECIRSRGIDYRRFETDSAELLAMVQVPEEWPAFSTLLEEFQALSASMPSFTLIKIPRTSNVKADCLARSSRDLVSESSFQPEFQAQWCHPPMFQTYYAQEPDLRAMMEQLLLGQANKQTEEARQFEELTQKLNSYSHDLSNQLESLTSSFQYMESSIASTSAPKPHQLLEQAIQNPREITVKAIHLHEENITEDSEVQVGEDLSLMEAQSEDGSKRDVLGIIENLPVKIGKARIPTDFVIMNMNQEPADPLIFGRPFLATVGAVIDVKMGTIKIHLAKDFTMKFDIKNTTHQPTIEGQHFMIGKKASCEVFEEGGNPRIKGSAQAKTVQELEGSIQVLDGLVKELQAQLKQKSLKKARPRLKLEKQHGSSAKAVVIKKEYKGYQVEPMGISSPPWYPTQA